MPGGVLFVFIAALGDDRQRVALSALLVGAGVVATVLLRAHHAPGGITDSTRGAPRVLIQAAGLAIAVALIAGYVGSRVPGANSEPLLETRGVGNGDSSALSPLVDIRSRLTNQRDVEMITVQASAESYWRATTLADFDGEIWRAPDRDHRCTGPQHAGRPTVGRRYSASRCASSASAGPRCRWRRIRSRPRDPPGLQYDAASSTLSTAEEELSAGDSYQMSSASPLFEPAVLAAATSLTPGDDIYFQLPDDFPADAAAAGPRR